MNYEKNAMFYESDGLKSKFFRIPFITKTSKGTTIAGTDVNFGSSGDSADKINVAIRRREKQNESNDYSKGWDKAFIPEPMHFRDFPDKFGYEQESTSFIDGMIVEDEIGISKKGRLFLAIDANAWNGGMIIRMIKESVPPVEYSKGIAEDYLYRLNNNILGDGFATINSKKYLLLSSKNITKKDELTRKDINMNIIRANFDFVADIYGAKNADGNYNIYHLVGTPKEYCIGLQDDNLSLGEISSYSLNGNYEVLLNGTVLTCTQEYTNESIPLNIMYKKSPLQVFNNTYHYLFISDDDGITWQLKTNLTGMVKYEDAIYYLTAPGRGLQIKNGINRGRLVFPVYFFKDGIERVSTIFSDDGGEIWQAGEPLIVENKLSESSIIELPSGNLQIFMRHSSNGGKVMMVENIGGEKFDISTFKSALGDNDVGVACQVSAVNLTAKVKSKKDGKTYPAIVLSSPHRPSRDNGRLHIGLIKEINGKYDIDFEYGFEICPESRKYGYTSLVEIRENVVGLLYECSPTDNFDDALNRMLYTEFDINKIIEK